MIDLNYYFFHNRIYIYNLKLIDSKCCTEITKSVSLYLLQAIKSYNPWKFTSSNQTVTHNSLDSGHNQVNNVEVHELK